MLPIVVTIGSFFVAFVELSSDHRKLRHNALKLLLLTFVLGLTGAYVRLLFGDISLTVCAFVVVLVMVIVLKVAKLYFPPAGALAILPLLIEPLNKIYAYVYVYFCPNG